LSIDLRQHKRLSENLNISLLSFTIYQLPARKVLCTHGTCNVLSTVSEHQTNRKFVKHKLCNVDRTDIERRKVAVDFEFE
jgi:hypothetical protein